MADAVLVRPLVARAGLDEEAQGCRADARHDFTMDLQTVGQRVIDEVRLHGRILRDGSRAGDAQQKTPMQRRSCHGRCTGRGERLA
jgi:hypothetical protein